MAKYGRFDPRNKKRNKQKNQSKYANEKRIRRVGKDYEEQQEV